MPEVAAQKGSENSCFSLLSRVRLFLAIQGARSRGFGREPQKWPGAGKGVLEDTFSSQGTGVIWVFPRLFPERDSRYNTHDFPELSPLALEGQRASQSGIGPPRAVAPKDWRKGAERSRLTPAPVG